MDLRSVLPLHRPVDPPARLRELIQSIRDVIRRMSALADVSNDEVPDLRGALDRMSVGDVGDFLSLALRAYKRQRYGNSSGARSLDFIEGEVRNVVIETGKVLRDARDRVRAYSDNFEGFLQDPVFHSAWALQRTALLRFLEVQLNELEQFERVLVTTVAYMAVGIEQWIDAVRNVGSPPSLDRQFAARDARLNDIRQHLSIVDASGRQQIRGGMVEVIHQILERGDLLLGADLDLQRWITGHMRILAANGVRVMLVDLPRTADHQRILDDFATSGDIGRLTMDLRTILPGTRSDASIAAAADLYAAARVYRIRVVAADTPFEYPHQSTSDRLRLAIPFWAASYAEVREAHPDQRVAIVADRGLSRIAGGLEGYFPDFPNVFSIDEYDPRFPQDQAVKPGEVAFDPWLRIPSAPDADFVFRLPSK